MIDAVVGHISGGDKERALKILPVFRISVVYHIGMPVLRQYHKFFPKNVDLCHNFNPQIVFISVAMFYLIFRPTTNICSTTGIRDTRLFSLF